MSLYSHLETNAIDSLRTKLEDLELNDNKSCSGFLVRWLRARDMNVEKAEEMIRKSMKWRQDENIDTILSWSPPAGIDNLAKYNMCGFDNEGSPVFIITYNCSDMDAFWAHEVDVHLKYASYICERIENAITLSSPRNPRRQAVFIYDFSELSLTKFWNTRGLTLLRKEAEISNENYPELVKRAYLVYAPRLFTIFFSITKHFLPASTIDKVQVHGYNQADWIKFLLNDIPADQLPEKYGGTKS